MREPELGKEQKEREKPNPPEQGPPGGLDPRTPKSPPELRAAALTNSGAPKIKFIF